MNSPQNVTSWNRERVVELLVEAGRLAISLRKTLKRELKADQSIVTHADRQVEALFTSEFDRPDEGVYLIGEETIEQKGEDYIAAALRGTGYVIDPIDGTAPFSHNLVHWGVSLGRMENGVLTDGAVYLPEIRGGELVLSDGDSVIFGERSGDEWTWTDVAPLPPDDDRSLISISQDMAKRGEVHCVGPVQALGTAVVPLLGILQGRFLAYVGKVKLWDVAGCLPLLARLGFRLAHFETDALPDGAPLDMTLDVNNTNYELAPTDRVRWRVRGGLLVCDAEKEEWLRTVLRTSPD